MEFPIRHPALIVVSFAAFPREIHNAPDAVIFPHILPEAMAPFVVEAGTPSAIAEKSRRAI
jgi:hypothetical protein